MPIENQEAADGSEESIVSHAFQFQWVPHIGSHWDSICLLKGITPTCRSIVLYLLQLTNHFSPNILIVSILVGLYSLVNVTLVIASAILWL